MNFIVGYQHPLSANETRTARWQIEHVALSEQTIGAIFVENYPAIDLGCDLKRNAAGNIRFDYARDDIRAGRLSGNKKMNAGRTSHLRDTRDRALNIGGGGGAL